MLIINVLPKLHLRLGALESTQSQPVFLQVVDCQLLQKKPDGYGVEKNMVPGRKKHIKNSENFGKNGVLLGF